MSKFFPRSGRFTGWMLAWLVAAGLGVALLNGRLRAAPDDDAAAKWKTLEAEIPPVYKERKELNARRSKARSMILGSAPLDEAALNEYYGQYQFPSWTLTDEEHLGALAKDRERFMTFDLGKSPGPVHDKLVELAFTRMSQFARDQDLHPAVRYNAVLILGGLNQREADSINRTNPEPLPKAYPTLEALFLNDDESDAVRVAAMLGVLRHLEWDDFRVATPKLPADKKAAIAQQLIALAEMSEPPGGRSLEGHTWMRRRALEGLMFVSQAGPSREIADVFANLVSDDKEPLALRCAAADIMGRLDYKAPVVPASEVSGKQLGLLALASCQAELTRLEQHEKLASLRTKLPTQYGIGMAGGMGGGTMGMAGGAPPGMAAANTAAPTMDMTKMMEGMAGGPKGGKKGKSKSKDKKGTNPLDMLGQGPGAVPGMGAKADDKNYRLEYIRRRLRSWLYAVQVGLGDPRANPANEIVRSGVGKNATYTPTYNRGVAKFAETDDQKKEIAEVIARVQKLVEIVEARETTYETFVEDLGAKMKELEELTGPLPAAAAPPAEGSGATIPPAAAAVPEVPGEAPAAAKAPAPAATKAAAPATKAPATKAAAPAATNGAAPDDTKTPPSATPAEAKSP